MVKTSNKFLWKATGVIEKRVGMGFSFGEKYDFEHDRNQDISDNIDAFSRFSSSVRIYF